MEDKVQILIVDDDPRICRLLSRYLLQEGYGVQTAGSGQEMRNILNKNPVDLVLLDLRLPGEDGFALARELRSRSDVAIIMVTGRTDAVDKVAGLELGADDYVTKPFDERELLARVRSVLRRARPPQESAGPASDRQGSSARFGGWQIDLETYELTSPQGERVHLTTREFQVLAAFVRHPRHVLSRDEILDLVAGREYVPFDRSVDVVIGKLRRKLGDDSREPLLIKTVRGVGYKLAPPVEPQ